MGTNRALLVTENGKTTRYGSIKEAAIELGMSPSALGARLRRSVDDGRIYVFVNKNEDEDEQKYDDTLTNGRRKVKYETLGTRICTTPCRHKDWVKIGSVLCQACNSFGGINRTEHFVVCSFKTY